MPASNVLDILGVIIAVAVLLFLAVAFTYLVAPQFLDRRLRGLGLHRGIGVLTAANVFRALSKLGGFMVLLGVITLAMVWFNAWPRGWLIPAIQELVMAAILLGVGYFGSRGPSGKA